MPRVSVGDDSIRIRQFQAALQVSAVFLEHLVRLGPPSAAPQTLFENLNERWRLLHSLGDQPANVYADKMRRELPNLFDYPGHELLRSVVTDLEKPFDWKHRLLTVNNLALEQVRQCVHEWGGPKAEARVSRLKPRSIHCETTGDLDTKFFFDREADRLLVRPGYLTPLLSECMILEFSLFHEYLSHCFPCWVEDREEVSEGFLFALGFEWYLSTNSSFDDDLLEQVWRSRLGEQGREYFRVGQWLLRRPCDGLNLCFNRFLLEWVAVWREYPEDLHLDLISELVGVAKRAVSRFASSGKRNKTLEIFGQLLCGGCEGSDWNLEDIVGRLAEALQSYDVPT